MLVNIGCGGFYADGWFNIDIWPGVKAEMHASAVALPLAKECAERVYMGHVLEHLPAAATYRALCEAWRILKPDGVLCVVGPDLDKIDKVSDPELWQLLAEGGEAGRDDPYILHKWRCTGRRLLTMVREVFPNAYAIELIGPLTAWPLVSRAPWQCAVLASKEQ